MTKLEIIWQNVEKTLDDNNLAHTEVAKIISNKTNYKVAYAEAFIMATKNMVTGKPFTRNVGSKILETLAFNILKKYGNSVRKNILTALQLYMEYNSKKSTNSKAVKDLIEKISQNKKILLIKTGGTIGTSEKKGVRALSKTTHDLLFSLSPVSKDNFEIASPLNILSENLTVSDWQILLDYVKGVNFDDFCGVIITHGTDTLAYTSAFIALITRGLNIPIVMVASNHPLTDPRSNGATNFRDAVNLILSNRYVGTFVCFGGEIFEGETIQNWQPFNKTYTRFKSNNHLQKDYLCQYNLPLYKTLTTLKSGIVIMHPYPDINYNRINLSQVSAVIRTTYHSFTYSNQIELLKKRCAEHNVPLIVAPTKKNETTSYESKVDGLMEVPDTSLETVFAMAVCGMFTIQKS
ncbi:MAG: asparaginase [Firmicutes bacterium]|nr:asparaginase [Bacillota bacterium]